MAEGCAHVAARDGACHPLVQLRHHPWRGRAAHDLLYAGHGRARRRHGGVLHRHRAVRVLGDAPRGLHLTGVRARRAAGGQVPGAERPRVPDGGGRVLVDLRVVRGGDRRGQLPVPRADDPGAGAEPGVDCGGDAERGEPDGEPGDRALLSARHAVERAVQLPPRAELQPRQCLPGLAFRAHHRGAAHPGARAQPPGGRGRVHVLLRALLPPRHERRLQLRQQLGLRPHRGVRAGVRAGVAEHLGPVRGAAGDGGAGGLGHHELGVLPDGRDERRAVRGAGGVLGVRDAPALHGHRVAAGLLRRVPDDQDRHGAAAGVRGVLLRVLRREPHVAAVRRHHPGADAQDAGAPRPGRRVHAAVPAPARRRVTGRPAPTPRPVRPIHRRDPVCAAPFDPVTGGGFCSRVEETELKLDS